MMGLRGLRTTRRPERSRMGDLGEFFEETGRVSPRTMMVGPRVKLDAVPTRVGVNGQSGELLQENGLSLCKPR